MMSQAKVISVTDSNPEVAATTSVPSSLYKGKLEPLIKRAKAAITVVLITCANYCAEGGTFAGRCRVCISSSVEVRRSDEY